MTGRAATQIETCLQAQLRRLPQATPANFYTHSYGNDLNNLFTRYIAALRQASSGRKRKNRKKIGDRPRFKKNRDKNRGQTTI